MPASDFDHGSAVVTNGPAPPTGTESVRTEPAGQAVHSAAMDVRSVAKGVSSPAKQASSMANEARNTMDEASNAIDQASNAVDEAPNTTDDASNAVEQASNTADHASNAVYEMDKTPFFDQKSVLCGILTGVSCHSMTRMKATANFWTDNDRLGQASRASPVRRGVVIPRDAQAHILPGLPGSS